VSEEIFCILRIHKQNFHFIDFSTEVILSFRQQYNYLSDHLKRILFQIRRQMPLSIHALPIDIVYRIFDHLNEKDLFISINNVNQRLNAILNSYQRFQVNSK